jgi:hypothetical protein
MTTNDILSINDGFGSQFEAYIEGNTIVLALSHTDRETRIFTLEVSDAEETRNFMTRFLRQHLHE